MRTKQNATGKLPRYKHVVPDNVADPTHSFKA